MQKINLGAARVCLLERMGSCLPKPIFGIFVCVRTTSVLAQNPAESQQGKCMDRKKVEIIRGHIRNWSLKGSVFISKTILFGAVMCFNSGARDDVLRSLNTKCS